jgi:hypothetical protein
MCKWDVIVKNIFLGYGILTAACLFTLKSVRYLILRKGGDKLTFVTYTPFGKNRMMTVDVNKASILILTEILHYYFALSGIYRTLFWAVFCW